MDSTTALLELKDRIIKYDKLIGVIGHRELLTEDCEYLESGEIDRSKTFYKLIENKIEELINSNDGNKLALISPLAKGSDQLVAQVARDKGLDVICVLPFSKVDYVKKQGDSGSKFFENFQTESPFVIVDPEITKKSEDLSYELVGKFLTLNCDSVLFLWDGVYTGNRGGTSDSYHLAVGGFCLDENFTKAFKIRNPQKRVLHHLSTPKADNPYPVGKRYINGGKECFADYTKVYPYQWHTEEIDNPIENFKKKGKSTSGTQSIIRNRFFWAYIIPFVLGIGMVVAWAFSYFDNMGSHNGFWSHTKEFLRMLKMPGGNLESEFPFSSCPENTAIALGIIVFVYIMVVTLIYILSNDRRIAVTLIEGGFNRRYNLILGLGWKGMELAQNIKGISRKKVVVVDKNESNENTKWALRKGIRVINGNFYNADILTKIGWHKAQDIYILGDNDETNIRALQLLDSQLKNSKKPQNNQKIGVHVHLDDFRNKYFVSKSLHSSSHINLNCFNVYENAVRRILLKHPLDRFYYSTVREKLEIFQADTVKVVILGYNSVAQALFRHCFTHCIYEADKKVEIEVYIENEQDFELIKKDIPYVFKSVKDGATTKFYLEDDRDSAAQYVYEKFSVSVRNLPQSEYTILNDAEYITNIKQNETTSIFACIDDGLRSTAYLSAILPALEVKKQSKEADVQVYCYFNFPEERDNSFIEESINKIAKTIPIFYFGNFAEELTEEAIKNQEQDELAKMINEFYCVSKQEDKVRDIRDGGQIEVGLAKLLELKDTEGSKEAFDNKVKKWHYKHWDELDEYKRESSRLAADHISIKLRNLRVYLEKASSEEKRKEVVFNSNNYFWDTINSQIPPKEGAEITDHLYHITEMEHRRWCAERLFYGWKCLEDQEVTIEEWYAVRKKKYEPLKIHIDLQPFDVIHKKEKGKDLIITENIDLMVWLMDKLELYPGN